MPHPRGHELPEGFPCDEPDYRGLGSEPCWFLWMASQFSPSSPLCPAVLWAQTKNKLCRNVRQYRNIGPRVKVHVAGCWL